MSPSMGSCGLYILSDVESCGWVLMLTAEELSSPKAGRLRDYTYSVVVQNHLGGVRGKCLLQYGV